MPEYRVYYYDKNQKRSNFRIYNPDTAKFICQTDRGKLYKKPRKCNFYLFDPRKDKTRDKFTEVTFNEAKNLVRKFGTKEQYCEYFSVLNPDGSFKEGTSKFVIHLDEIHRIKLFRTASLLSMSVTECIGYLIDKYDDMKNFNHNFTTARNKINKRPSPSELSDFT